MSNTQILAKIFVPVLGEIFANRDTIKQNMLLF